MCICFSLGHQELFAQDFRNGKLLLNGEGESMLEGKMIHRKEWRWGRRWNKDKGKLHSATYTYKYSGC